ncbi:MAG: hypothetical protein ACRD68_06930, partial [Pyrinomonadaceae bacterium]
MAGALKKINSLRGRSLDELRVRGSQQLACLAERAGRSDLVRLPDDEALFAMFNASAAEKGSPSVSSAASLLEYFRARTSPNFFAAFSDRRATVAELQRRFGPN